MTEMELISTALIIVVYVLGVVTGAYFLTQIEKSIDNKFKRR